MKKMIPLLLLLACALPACSSIPLLAPSPTPEWERPGWTIVWQDEFDSETLSPENWTFDIGGGGWGNQEWQAYTSRPENVRIENGMLVIEAREEPQFVSGRSYSSARIKTQGLQSWQYGRIEGRMKLPHGQGIWPAFWMLGADFNKKGWPAAGEIDIMEFIGKEPNTLHATIHAPGYAGGVVTGKFDMPDGALKDEFHVFAVEWDADGIRWFVDDQQYYEVKATEVPGEWIFDRPFFILINLAVGGRWPGYPDKTTVFPQFLYMDYVRVYQK